MLKKNEVLEALKNGGHITLCEIYRSANVYTAASEHIDTCRYDTAEKIGQMDGFEDVRIGSGWNYTRYIRKPGAEAAAREAAAEELEKITAPGGIELRAKHPIRIGDRMVKGGQHFTITVYGDGTHSAPGNAYGDLYDFRTAEHAIYFEILSHPEEAEEMRCEVCGEILATGEDFADDLGRRCCCHCFADRCQEQGFPEIAEAVLAAAPTLEASQEETTGSTYRRPVIEYTRMDTEEDTGSATRAMIWHRAGCDVIVSRHYPGDTYPILGALVHGATQEAPRQERNAHEENRNHCRRIAEEIDAYAAGEVCRCPECGEILHLPDDVGDKYRCPECGEVSDLNDLELLGMWDYLADCLDVEYRCGSDREYRSCQIMIAWGGPNIYLDTASKAVELYWWNESARYFLSDEAVNAIDEWAEEYWRCL